MLVAAMQHVSPKRPFTVKDGETLIEAGTRSTKIYLLVSGQLFVSVSRLGGTAKIVAKIRPGAIVGEMNFYIQGERTANVVAEGAAQVLSIDIQSFEALLGERISSCGSLPQGYGTPAVESSSAHDHATA